MWIQDRRQFLKNGSALWIVGFGLAACGGNGESGGESDGTAANRREGVVYGDAVLGNADAPVEIVEYASMTCGACAYFHASTYPELKAKYVDTGQVKFIVRNFVANSVDLSASMVARCSGEGQFYAVTDLMFRSREEMLGQDPISGIAGIVRRAGISRADVDACLQDRELQKAIVASRDEGARRFGVSSTPTFVINGEEVVVGAQSIEDFDRILAKYF